MESKLKLVEYSDSDDSEAEENVPVSEQNQASCVDVYSITDSQGRQVAVVEPTPQTVAVVNPMTSSSDEDLDGTGLFDPGESDPLATQPTLSSSGPDHLDPSFVSQDISDVLHVEIPREDIIVISDSSPDTVVISPPRHADDHMSATSGNY